MKAVRGQYNGSVVVLDEPAPVDRGVPVVVSFSEEGDDLVVMASRPSPGASRLTWGVLQPAS